MVLIWPLGKGFGQRCAEEGATGKEHFKTGGQRSSGKEGGEDRRRPVH